jgi:hypothetical protein
MGFGRHAEMMEPPHPRQAMAQGRRGERSLREGGRFNFEIRKFLIATFLVPKMTILGLKTATFGSLIQIFQYDSLARPQRTKTILFNRGQRFCLRNSETPWALRETLCDCPRPYTRKLRISPPYFLRKKAVLYMVQGFDKKESLKHVDHIFGT